MVCLKEERLSKTNEMMLVADGFCRTVRGNDRQAAARMCCLSAEKTEKAVDGFGMN